MSSADPHVRRHVTHLRRHTLRVILTVRLAASLGPMLAVWSRPDTVAHRGEVTVVTCLLATVALVEIVGNERADLTAQRRLTVLLSADAVATLLSLVATYEAVPDVSLQHWANPVLPWIMLTGGMLWPAAIAGAVGGVAGAGLVMAMVVGGRLMSTEAAGASPGDGTDLTQAWPWAVLALGVGFLVTTTRRATVQLVSSRDAAVRDRIHHRVQQRLLAARRYLDHGDTPAAAQHVDGAVSNLRELLAPVPSADGPLSSVLDAISEAQDLWGADLDVRTDGLHAPAAGVPQTVSDALHEIAFEAVTNAAKHQSGVPVRVGLSDEDDELVLSVAQARRRPVGAAGSGQGRGITLMVRRAADVGGSVVVHDEQDVFVLVARLPRR